MAGPHFQPGEQVGDRVTVRSVDYDDHLRDYLYSVVFDGYLQPDMTASEVYHLANSDGSSESSDQSSGRGVSEGVARVVFWIIIAIGIAWAMAPLPTP